MVRKDQPELFRAPSFGNLLTTRRNPGGVALEAVGGGGGGDHLLGGRRSLEKSLHLTLNRSDASESWTCPSLRDEP